MREKLRRGSRLAIRACQVLLRLRRYVLRAWQWRAWGRRVVEGEIERRCRWSR